MFYWFRRFLRRRTKPIPGDVATTWYRRLSVVYALLAWNAFGFVIYSFATGRGNPAKYYGVEDDTPKKRYSEEWADILGIKKAHVIQMSGFKKVGEYDIDRTRVDSSDLTENLSDVTEEEPSVV